MTGFQKSKRNKQGEMLKYKMFNGHIRIWKIISLLMFTLKQLHFQNCGERTVCGCEEINLNRQCKIDNYSRK